MKTTPASISAIQQKYRGLRQLLSANTELLEMMADIKADLLHLSPGECRFRENVIALLERTLLLIQDLELLADGRYGELFEIHRQIELESREYLRASSIRKPQRLCLPLKDVDSRMTMEVGGKAASVGDLSRLLPAAVPAGFVLTTDAYRLFLQENDLSVRIRNLINDINLIADSHLFSRRIEKIRRLIQNSPVPASIMEAISDGLNRQPAPAAAGWAVRSSAVGENGNVSFAGQFRTLLNVPQDELPDAYKAVLASRYSERAVQYRKAMDCSEVDTPMAVLFQPMVNARSAGVLYTRDPHDHGADNMMINSVWGLAEKMVQGETAAEVFLVSRREPGVIVSRRPAGDARESGRLPSLTSVQVKALVETALEVEKHFGCPQDIEWAVDEEGRVKLLQSRELRLDEGLRKPARVDGNISPLLSGGTTIFSGLAVGQAWILHSGRDLDSTPEGCILITEQATPEVAVALPRIAGLIAAHGNAAGHAATLIREFAVPTIFGIPDPAEAIGDGRMISVDATRRAVYDGNLWPDVEERVRARIHHPVSSKPSGLLQERILALNLVDPQAISFRPKSCRSIHDIIRFVHEKAVDTMFRVGDDHAGRYGSSAKTLKTGIPLNLLILDLGGGIHPDSREKSAVEPEEITSVPFRALWKGITSPGIKWTGRRRVSAAGFASVLGSSLAQGSGGRGLGTANYLMIGSDYLCLNARLAYHFAMIDTVIGDAAENNYVNFRFRGGGAGANRRDLRAQFLTQVLLRSGFDVDRRGDLVTAWLRRYPRVTCGEGLSLLGRLMGCARQLDLILESRNDVNAYAERFIRGDFEAFA